MFNGDIDNMADAIIEINDSLTSASIIVLVVTIGKHFETKIKKNCFRDIKFIGRELYVHCTYYTL